MSPGVPYVSVRSNDVLNGSLDLVLRLCTRVDTVWRVLRPGREVGIFLLDPLPVRRLRVSLNTGGAATYWHDREGEIQSAEPVSRGEDVGRERVCKE